jgi:hypothetical protein
VIVRNRKTPAAIAGIGTVKYWSNVIVVKMVKLSQIAMIVEIEEISSIA